MKNVILVKFITSIFFPAHSNQKKKMKINEESVFLTISGYTKAENTNGTFTSEKPPNNREIDLIRLECDFEDGNIVNRIRHSFL